MTVFTTLCTRYTSHHSTVYTVYLLFCVANYNIPLLDRYRFSRGAQRSDIVVRVHAQALADAGPDTELGRRHSAQHQLPVRAGHGQADVLTIQPGPRPMAMGHIQRDHAQGEVQLPLVGLAVSVIYRRVNICQVLWGKLFYFLKDPL